jgi:hypothetical protein
MESCKRWSLVHFRSPKIRVVPTHSRWVDDRQAEPIAYYYRPGGSNISSSSEDDTTSYICVQVYNSFSGVVPQKRWVYLVTLSASCTANRRTWACQAHLREKMDQLQRWSEANPCIPQHILTFCFQQVTYQIKRLISRWMEKWLEPICILETIVWNESYILILEEQYLAEQPLILPLPAGSRSPCHLWCPTGKIHPVSPAASQGNFTHC